MKPPRNADELTLRWSGLTATTQCRGIQMHHTYSPGLSWHGDLKIGFRARIAVLRGAFFFA